MSKNGKIIENIEERINELQRKIQNQPEFAKDLDDDLVKKEFDEYNRFIAYELEGMPEDERLKGRIYDTFNDISDYFRKKTQSRYNNCRDEEKNGFDLLSRRGYTLLSNIEETLQSDIEEAKENISDHINRYSQVKEEVSEVNKDERNKAKYEVEGMISDEMLQEIRGFMYNYEFESKEEFMYRVSDYLKNNLPQKLNDNFDEISYGIDKNVGIIFDDTLRDIQDKTMEELEKEIDQKDEKENVDNQEQEVNKEEKRDSFMGTLKEGVNSEENIIRNDVYEISEEKSNERDNKNKEINDDKTI